LRENHSNIVGGIMDDFFNSPRPNFSLTDISQQMSEAGLTLWIVLYDQYLNRPDLAVKLAL